MAAVVVVVEEESMEVEEAADVEEEEVAVEEEEVAVEEEEVIAFIKQQKMSIRRSCC